MRSFFTKQSDDDALPARTAPAAARPNLSRAMVHAFLRQVLPSLDAESEPWREQLALTPRGADFDLRDADDGMSVLDKLAMGGDALGEAIARGDPPREVGQGVLPHLEVPIETLARYRHAAKTDARQQMLLREHGAVLSRLEDDVVVIGRTMSELSRVAAHGAATLDPDATRRILDRMREIGRASCRESASTSARAAWP